MVEGGPAEDEEGHPIPLTLDEPFYHHHPDEGLAKTDPVAKERPPHTATREMSSEFRDLIPRALANLLRRGFDHDIEIEVGQAPNAKTFQAHMCVLRARSTYFFAALSESWKGDRKTGTVFKKPDISPAVFAIILK